MDKLFRIYSMKINGWGGGVITFFFMCKYLQTLNMCCCLKIVTHIIFREVAGILIANNTNTLEDNHN